MSISRVAAITGVLAFLTIAPSAAQSARVHLVNRIFLDDKSVQSAPVTVIRGSTVAHVLHVGDVVVDRTRIDVPSNVVVVFKSMGEKSTITLERGASVTFVSTGKGELVSSNAGTTLFSVMPKALDFFRVQSGESLTASVHGTDFSIERTSKTVSFNCTLGEVSITKTGYILIGQRRLQTSLIDIISAAATPQLTYHPRPNWTLAEFANFAQAEAFYRAQLKAALAAGDSNAANVARINLGNVLRLEGRYSDSLQIYRLALDSYKRSGDEDGEARATEGTGITLAAGGRRGAAASLKEALSLFGSVGDVDGQAGVLKDQGSLAVDDARYGDALQYHQESLVFYREVNDGAGEARELHNIGVVQRSVGEYAAALRSFRQALSIYKSLDDRDGETTLMVSIGLTQYYEEMYGRALNSFQNAAAMAAQLGDRFLVATATAEIGVVKERQGRSAEALTWLAHARILFEKLGFADGEMEARLNTAIVESDIGHYAEALQSLTAVRGGFASLGDRVDEAQAMNAIANVHMHLGQYDDALKFGDQALALFRGIGDLYDEAGSLVTLGDILRRQPRYSEALDSYRGALKIYRQIGATVSEKETSRRIADTQSLLKRASPQH